jgi:hypothetical protein
MNATAHESLMYSPICNYSVSAAALEQRLTTPNISASWSRASQPSTSVSIGYSQPAGSRKFADSRTGLSFTV